MSFLPQLLRFLNQAQTNNLHTADYEKIYQGLSVKVSFGQARKAKTPWIAFLDGSQKVSNGIYPVLLYYDKFSLLILTYGISEEKKPNLRWGLKNIEQIKDILDIKKYGYRYGESHVFNKYFLDFSLENYGLNEKSIEKDINKIIYQYKAVLKGKKLTITSQKSIEPEIRECEEIRPEGRIKVVVSHLAERNPVLRKEAIKFHGTKCKVCGFDFQEAYGKERGEDFIEIHHAHPLRDGKNYMERMTNYKTDLTPVCSNCHRMIHRKREEILSIEHLKTILNKDYNHN